MGKNQHVMPHKNGWQVKGEGNQKASHVERNQQQAIKIGRDISRNNKSELVIHGKDGKIRQKDSHGHDPFPPKG